MSYDLSKLLSVGQSFSRVEDYHLAKKWAEEAFRQGHLSRDDEISSLKKAYVQALGRFNDLQEAINKVKVEEGCDCSVCTALRLAQMVDSV